MSNEQPKKSSTGLDENLASLLCYVVGFITGIVFLVIEKDNKTVRFHAMQSLITFGALFVLQMVIAFIPVVRHFAFIVSLASLGLWILLMVKAFQGGMFKLPVVGDIAEKQVNK
jgi:uncharacterized membrane protein